jgi:hypothetical protein
VRQRRCCRSQILVRVRRTGVGGTSLRLGLVRGGEDATSATRRTMMWARSSHPGVAEDQNQCHGSGHVVQRG